MCVFRFIGSDAFFGGEERERVPLGFVGYNDFNYFLKVIFVRHTVYKFSYTTIRYIVFYESVQNFG